MMKKTVLILSAILLSAGLSFGQSMKEATETAQSANEALQAGQYEIALTGFKSALASAEGLGDEGKELAATCKGAIPKIMLAIAKKQATTGDYDNALKGCGEVIELCAKYGTAEDVSKEAQSIIPEITLSKGVDQLKAENYAGAIEDFKKVLELEESNGAANFYLGQALSKTGDNDAAVAAFQKAIELGYQKETAEKQIVNINLKKALAAYKKGSLAEAVEGAAACAEAAGSNAQIKNSACGIIVGCTQTAAVKNNRPDEAVNYYNKLAAIAPTNNKLGTLAYYIGATYFKNKNNAQAKTWLSKAASDPAVGANAKQILASIK